MHSYSFSFDVTSIETIQIVQNFVFGVGRDSSLRSVLQWDLNQNFITDNDEKCFLTVQDVLRVTSSCSVVAIRGKYFYIIKFSSSLNYRGFGCVI